MTLSERVLREDGGDGSEKELSAVCFERGVGEGRIAGGLNGALHSII